jgi:hypothetical protein
MSICEEDHIADLCSVLLEENWIIVPSPPNDSTCSGVMTFCKRGTDYDQICIRPDNNNRTSSTTGDLGFWITVPLPTRSGAYLTHITTSLGVYLYITNFIEYYADTTLSLIQQQ